MGTTSKIEWTDHTWNPWRGCQHAILADASPHPGCEHCYAETLSKRNPRMLGTWGADGVRVVGAEANWNLPHAWNKAAEKAGRIDRVFVASLADAFEDWQGPIMAPCKQPVYMGKDYRASRGPDDRLTMQEMRFRVFRTFDKCPHLLFLVLTKRPGNVRRMMMPWLRDRMGAGRESPDDAWVQGLPARNIMLGTSISDQRTADELLPQLLNCRDLCGGLFLSSEPLLGPINLARVRLDGMPLGTRVGVDSVVGLTIDWVIAGGESGAGARPMHPDWVRGLRDQCVAAGVPFFFKQWGEWAPHNTPAPIGGRDTPRTLVGRDDDEMIMYRVGKAKAGAVLDGREWRELPGGITKSQVPKSQRMTMTE